MTEVKSTPEATVAWLSRTVPAVVDQVTGGRETAPLVTCYAVCEALGILGIKAHTVYGRAAWVEISNEQKPRWTGSWSQYHFWVKTEFDETVDFTIGAAHRGIALYSAPNLFTREIPKFYQFRTEGIVETEAENPKEREVMDRISKRIRDEAVAWQKSGSLMGDFINEPLILSQRRLLDDSKQSFQHFDRALSVSGIPHWHL